MRSFATVTALWLFGLPSALAQPGDWLILPTTTSDQTAWMEPTVERLDQELRKQGIGVWPPERAIRAFEERGSALPVLLSEEQIDAWAALSHNALRMLSRAETQAALAALEDLQAFAHHALEALNREPENAQTVLDTCLYLVRAQLQSGDADGASKQVEECVQMVPLGEPSRRMHPPQILALYEAAQQPGARHASTLRVESQPPKCPLRVNGVPVGKTPTTLTGLYPGTYRIQLECAPDRENRVHIVDLRPGRGSLFIFERFDRAVRSNPVLHLRYEDPPDMQQIAIDARQIARTLPAQAVVTASMAREGWLELRVVTTAQIEPTLARINTSADGPSETAVAEAVSALLAGRCADFRGEQPIPIDCRTGEPVKDDREPAASPAKTRPHARPPRGQFVSGLALASVGTASMLAGYGVFIARRPTGDDWIANPNSLAVQDKWLRMGTGLIATSAAGAGALVAAMPLALPYRDKTPWWAWLSGGVGVAATVGAIVSVATADPKPPQSCSINGPDPASCVERGRDTDRAIILGMTAAPLLTMPLVYLLRRGDKKRSADLEPMIGVGRGRGAVGLRGVF